MLRSILLVSTTVLAAGWLAGCASALEDTSQRVEFRIVGSDSALCHVKTEDYYYKVYAPTTVTIQKTRKPLNLRCVATGNRERVAKIEPQVNDMVAANISNGVVPGMVWDYATGAVYEFPDVITVDFTGVRANPTPLPEYQRVLNQNPSLIGLEEFRPGRAALISDFSNEVPTLQRRAEDESTFDEFGTQSEGAISTEGKIVAPADSIAAPVSSRSQIMTESPEYGTPPAGFVKQSGEGGTESPASGSLAAPPRASQRSMGIPSADSLTKEANPGSF